MQDLGSSNQYLGFTRMVEIQASNYPKSASLTRIIAAIGRQGGVVYPVKNRQNYKVSCAPDTIVLGYFVYRVNFLLASLLPS
jgi:hypothetical protein